MMSVVATGRRIEDVGEVHERTSAAGLTSTLTPGARRTWPSVTTRSSGRQARRDHDVASLPPAHGHRPRLDRRVVLDDEDVGPLLPRLDGFGGNHERGGIMGEGQDDLDEAAGPERAARIGKGRLQADRAGRAVDGVVDEGELAGLGGLVVAGFLCAAGTGANRAGRGRRRRARRAGREPREIRGAPRGPRHDGQLGLRLGPADGVEGRLGDREDDRDRPHLVDRDERALVVGPQHVPAVHLDAAPSARRWERESSHTRAAAAHSRPRPRPPAPWRAPPPRPPASARTAPASRSPS